MTSGHVGFFLWNVQLGIRVDGAFTFLLESLGWSSGTYREHLNASHDNQLYIVETLKVIHIKRNPHKHNYWKNLVRIILAVHCTTSIDTILHFSSISAQYNRSRAYLYLAQHLSQRPSHRSPHFSPYSLVQRDPVLNAVNGKNGTVSGTDFFNGRQRMVSFGPFGPVLGSKI
jgi:hypothetical protein